MRIICLLGAGALVSQTAAAESIRAETCSKGADVRVIEVVSPGTVGVACDVVYSRDGGANVAVPYNANVDKDFCRARAAELAANLIADGFDCSTAASQSLEASLAGGSAAPVAEDAPLDVQLQQIANAEAPPAPADTLEQPQTIETADTSAQPIATEEAAKIAAPHAPADPIQLAADARTSEFRAPRPPKSTGPGRIVGAQPSIDDIIDVSTAPKAGSTPSAPTGGGAIPARASDDIIRGVLSANAAAWNEGNLEAFMGGYADSDELTLIKDAAVTTGRRDVRKAFEQEIAANEGMGRLAFDDVEVSMTSPEIATVVGRYTLAHGVTISTGVMTLVMKQIDGRWRIMQDTRISGASPTP
jgi:ketosteroid isomerase-like protein